MDNLLVVKLGGGEGLDGEVTHAAKQGEDEDE